MTESVAVLGATGVYGRHLVPRLTGAGHRVRALDRRPETASEPPQAGGRNQMPSFRVTNAKARDALNWAPLYPDFRAGLAR